MQKVFRCLLIVLACCLWQCSRAQCIVDLLAQDLNNAKTSQAYKDFIKGNPEGMMAYKKLAAHPYVRRDLDVLKSTSKLLTNHAEFFGNRPGVFEKIIKNLASEKVKVRCNGCSGTNAGIPKLDVIVDDMDWVLTEFKNKDVNVESIFTEMAAGNGSDINTFKADGGSFLINAMRKSAAQDVNYVKSIEKFEYKFLDDGNFEADIYRTIDGKTYLSEFKSLGETRWYGFSTDEQSVKQFMAYFTKKEKFEYFANASKLGGRDKANELVRKQFVKLFKSKAEDLFEINPSFFENIKYNGEKIKIDNFQEFKNYCDKTDFYNSSLFDFINVILIE